MATAQSPKVKRMLSPKVSDLESFLVMAHSVEQGAARERLKTMIVPLICLGRNKDLCSWRSKYKSYGALRGCDLGVRDCLQVYCGK